MSHTPVTRRSAGDFPILPRAPLRLLPLLLLLATLPACAGSLPPGSGPGAGGALRVVSYNIRHGQGMDGRVDLARTARVLRELSPDLVALQEVDQGVERSGGVDQAAELGRLLGLEHAFGAFMPYQGGAYGLALLSRHPVARSWTVGLPAGHEPRVALAAAVVLPGGDTLVAIGVHFDWVEDDGFRFAQARTLAAVLDTLSHPYVLLGDLNDVPGSRTLELFHARAREATKPDGGRLTFPSGKPVKEIDHVFAAPRDRWRIREVRVAAEPLASDHRPVLAVLHGPAPHGGRR